MARQADGVRLLAIGLLNFADDEGYFYADAAFVRNALRPLDDDSASTRRMLEVLSRIGWVEIREHPTQGKIGKILSFLKHQKIDRPTPSKIGVYYTSSSTRRTIDEDSLLDQGSGIRDQGSGIRDQGSGIRDQGSGNGMRARR